MSKLTEKKLKQALEKADFNDIKFPIPGMENIELTIHPVTLDEWDVVYYSIPDAPIPKGFGGNTIEEIANQLDNYANIIKDHDEKINSLMDYFDSHIKNNFDKEIPGLEAFLCDEYRKDNNNMSFYEFQSSFEFLQAASQKFGISENAVIDGIAFYSNLHYFHEQHKELTGYYPGNDFYQTWREIYKADKKRELPDISLYEIADKTESDKTNDETEEQHEL